MFNYLKRDLKFRIFFLILSIFCGTSFYFQVHANGIFIGSNDIWSFKMLILFILSVVCIFIPWHHFEKES